MNYFFIMVSLGLFFLMGCTAAQQPSEMSKLQIKVAQLERQLEEKNAEIENLRYDMKDLQVQNEKDDAYDVIEPEIDSGESSKTTSDSSGSDEEIIRVSASPQQVQKALKNAGYYDGPVDGKIGSRSRKAIQDFQKDNNLVSDGIVGKKTWVELKNYLN